MVLAVNGGQGRRLRFWLLLIDPGNETGIFHYWEWPYESQGINGTQAKTARNLKRLCLGYAQLAFQAQNRRRWIRRALEGQYELADEGIGVNIPNNLISGAQRRGSPSWSLVEKHRKKHAQPSGGQRNRGIPNTGGLADAVTVEEFNRQRKDTWGRYEDGQECRGPRQRSRLLQEASFEGRILPDQALSLAGSTRRSGRMQLLT